MYARPRLATPRYGSQGRDLARVSRAREKRRDFADDFGAFSSGSDEASSSLGAEKARAKRPRWVSHGAMVWRGASFIKNKLSREGSERREGDGGGTACLRACMAGVHTGNSGDQETERPRDRRDRDGKWEEEEEEEEKEVQQRRRRRRRSEPTRLHAGKTGEDTNRPRRSNLRRRPLLEGWKGGGASFGTGPSSRYEACFEQRPGEATRQVFVHDLLSRPGIRQPKSSKRSRNTPLFDEIGTVWENRYIRSNFMRKFHTRF